MVRGIIGSKSQNNKSEVEVRDPADDDIMLKVLFWEDSFSGFFHIPGLKGEERNSNQRLTV